MAIPSVRRAAPTVLVAAVFVINVELLRATSPLLDLAAGEIGVIGAARLAVLIFTAPVLIGLAVMVVGPARTILAAVVVLVALRLLAQAQDPPILLAVGAGAAVGIAALVLVVRQAPSGVAAAIGILLGTVADLTVRNAYGSWDLIFRPGVLPGVLTVAVCAVAVAALIAARPVLADAPAGRIGMAGVVGVYLALYVLGYGSAPILAAHAGVSLPLAGAVLAATAVAGIELVRRLRLPGASGMVPEPDRWFAGVVALLAVTGGVAAAYWLTGLVVLAAMVVAGLSAAVLLARALTPPRPVASRRPSVGFAGAGVAAGLGYVFPVMVYQIHYDLEFPFDNRLALLVAAALLGVAGLGIRPPANVELRVRPAASTWAVSVVAAVALLVPLGVALTRPAVPAADQAGATVRLMSWNVMYGRHHTRGSVDLAAVADAIEAVDPDVVLLQEVSRGWPIGGGTDMAQWLARRLGMRYEWSPAADGQFGNVLLTRLPLSEVAAVRLPFVQGPMDRSYLAATVHLDGGQELRLVNTHLQHRKENTPTRLVQSEVLLAAWEGAGRTIIAGDFNFWPSWPEAALWEAAGFVSAQDVTGHGAEFTVPSDDPDNRVDWIFGTPDLTFSDFAILTDVTNSDHFPLVVTVEVG